MSVDATKTAPKESFDYYMGPLTIDPGQGFLGAWDDQHGEQGYQRFPLASGWTIGSTFRPAVGQNREFGVLSTSEPGRFLRAFITGFQVVSGASAASNLAPRIIAVGADAISGMLTLTSLGADGASMSARMRQTTASRALVEARLEALAELSEGWLDGEGVAPTSASIKAARRLIWVLLNRGARRPRLAPTPEGGIEAEWTADDREVSVTFEPDGSLYGNSVDVATGEITEPELNPADDRTLADFVLGARGYD